MTWPLLFSLRMRSHLLRLHTSFSIAAARTSQREGQIRNSEHVGFQGMALLGRKRNSGPLHLLQLGSGQLRASAEK